MSGSRRRFIDDEFDLDLTYICKNKIIVMSFPATGVKTQWRNDARLVSHILFIYITRSKSFLISTIKNITWFIMSQNTFMSKKDLGVEYKISIGKTIMLHLLIYYFHQLNMLAIFSLILIKMLLSFTANQVKVELEPP